ncbi:Uncharacterized protein BM_BM10525 [Brugia malayi]|uniref:Bm10525 n=2 Tax=Brugia malayi TaxID=6279 RepID=A0A4E9FQX8_BRUMA|nr:Uncharacterized protein BM_BM10525 [Brugia malayi]VIO98922.1 Uncharacterized protein BM_BM10525 [Brugia malayi]
MAAKIQVAETASTTPVEQSSPTPTHTSTIGEKKSESTKRSHTKSSGSKRRKKKRETLPEGFDQWPETDQKYYQDISALLRDSKATRKQCSFTRHKIGVWKSLKLRWAYHPTHNTEMSAYKKALKEVTPLEKTENLDIDF